MTKLETEIWERLKEIPDPELNISIVDLGLVYEVKVKDEKAKIKMTLTTIGCPLFGTIQKMVENKVGEVSGIKAVETELVFDPPWSMDMISEDAKLKLGIL
ncbi:MAG: iron-sulfur cluster assembly protein [Patescibacteria group bacterium]|jgi:metal-sulfur cluster biosynthetic enzyme